MAIYKLKELLSSKPEYGANLPGLKNGKYKYFTQSNLSNKTTNLFVNETQNKIMNYNDFFISRAGTIDSYLHDKNEKWVFAGYIVKYPLNTRICCPKYIYYWTKSKGRIQIDKNSSGGSTMPKFNPPDAINLKINLPTINQQKSIIDIIEPNEKLFLKYSKCVRIDNFKNVQDDMKNLIDIIEPIEKIQSNLIRQLKLFSKYSEFIIENYNILGFMKDNCDFIKGTAITNYVQGKTLFLNVSAANNNPNKYCNIAPNVFPRDITLSLDGNTGLVNNNLLGFNGYLYKIESKIFSRWQIYYSLKNKINQKIIKLNETGTTIKHSSNSKTQLLLLDFKCKELLKIFFDIEINLKNQINLIKKQIEKLILILIR